MEQSMVTTKSRPLGVSIIAILLTIQGALEIVYGLLILVAAPSFVITSVHSTIIVPISPWGFLFSGILALVLSYGLWTLRKWAFWATVVLESINIIAGMVALFSYYNPTGVLLSMVIPAVILIYFLVDKDVLSAFDIKPAA